MAKIYFIVFDQAEVLDFSGPFDVFSMARVAMGADPYEMALVGVRKGPIRALHGFTVLAEMALSEIKPGPDDMIIVPGGGPSIVDAIIDGSGNPALVSELQEIVSWLKENAPQAGRVTSICVGAFFLAQAGLFAGQRVTTHHAFLDTLDSIVGPASPLPASEQATIRRGARYTLNDRIATSGGVSCGLDLSFALLKELWSPDAAEQTRIVMEYNGTTNFAVGS